MVSTKVKGNYPSFERIFSRFSPVEPFGYNNVSNEGTVTFWQNLGAISPSPPKRGQGNESNHGILK